MFSAQLPETENVPFAGKCKDAKKSDNFSAKFSNCKISLNLSRRNLSRKATKWLSWDVSLCASKLISPWVGAIYVYVEDVDAVYGRALKLGARPLAQLEDKPYQERQAGFLDVAGNTWWIATYKQAQ